MWVGVNQCPEASTEQKAEEGGRLPSPAALLSRDPWSHPLLPSGWDHTIGSPGSQAFRLALNHCTGSPGAPARTRQVVGLLGSIAA